MSKVHRPLTKAVPRHQADVANQNFHDLNANISQKNIVTSSSLTSSMKSYSIAQMSHLNEQDARFAREQLAKGCDTMERLLHGLLDTKGRIAEQVHAITNSENHCAADFHSSGWVRARPSKFRRSAAYFPVRAMPFHD